MARVGSCEVKITVVSANTSTWEQWLCSDLMLSELWFFLSKARSSSSPLPKNVNLQRQYPATKTIAVFPKWTQWHLPIASRWIRGYIYCSGPSLWGVHFLRGKYCPTKCPGSLCPLFSLERREHDGDKADCLKVWQDLSSSLVGKGKRIHIVMWLNGGYERSKISFCADFPAIQRELETVAHSAFPYTAQSHHTFCFPTILACIKCEAGSETACKREKTKTLSSSKCLNTLSR